jgi:5-formyltetrahydrofolate cyclo-ligase
MNGCNHATLCTMKSTLREMMLAQRLALTPDDVHAFSASLLQQLMHDSRITHARTIGLFHPIKHEPNLLGITHLFPNKQVYLPKVHDGVMDYVLYHEAYGQICSPLERSDLNIMEPAGQSYFKEPLDVILIPALAIDHQRHRLGFGKGFFDAYLARLRPKHVLAVIYPFQYVKTLPHEAHDERVDDVLIANLTTVNQ